MAKDKKVEKEKKEKSDKVPFSKKVGFISLGCDKNRVDTENIITKLSCYPCFSFVYNKQEADIIIINTCSFLQVARDEAEDTIREILELKRSGSLQKLIVAGCLPLLEGEEVLKKFPEVDKIIVPSDYNKIDEIVFSLFGEDIPEEKTEVEARIITTPMHYAYLKIADGCNNRCAYCKIPFIRGKYVSLPMEEILKEAEALTNKGVKEIILVAQDITRYGMDLYKGFKLVELLRSLAKLKKLSWIRLLYCYPDMLDQELIDEIENNHKVLKYIDIPLQHISNNVLKLMKRRGTKEEIIEKINLLRKKIPDIKIRSTFMVGFPGETEKDFKELCKFLTDFKLDNVGFFKYSREEGTASYDYENQVEEKVKDKRLKKVQDLQEKIATKNNLKLVGNTYKLICDEYDAKHNFYVGRPYFSAPDIDFQVLFSSYKKIKVGSFIDVKITDFNQGYFIGEVEFDEFAE